MSGFCRKCSYQATYGHQDPRWSFPIRFCLSCSHLGLSLSSARSPVTIPFASNHSVSAPKRQERADTIHFDRRADIENVSRCPHLAITLNCLTDWTTSPDLANDKAYDPLIQVLTTLFCANVSFSTGFVPACGTWLPPLAVTSRTVVFLLNTSFEWIIVCTHYALPRA